MLEFHPPGIGQQIIETSLGPVAYCAPLGDRWPSPSPTAPTLLFLHNFGGGASGFEWSGVYPAFLGDYPVRVPDLPGWGASAHPVRDYCIADYLQVLTEIIEALGTPTIAIASSLTAGITIRLAIQRPDLFHSLVLACPSGFADFGQDAGRRLPLQLIGLPWVDQIIYRVGATTEVSVRNFLERFLFANPARVSPAMVAAYLASAQQPNGEYAALAFLRGDLYFDLSRYMGQLQTPTLMLWGTASQFTPLSLGRRLAGLSPQVKSFVAIPDAGVLPHLEQPAVVTGVLRRWLQGHPGA